MTKKQADKLSKYLSEQFYLPLAKGDCLDHVVRYLAACNAYDDAKHPMDMVLCQGICHTNGRAWLHCWIERGETVIDLVAMYLRIDGGYGRPWQRTDYYKKFNVGDVKRYSGQDILARTKTESKFFDRSDADIAALTTKE